MEFCHGSILYYHAIQDDSFWGEWLGTDIKTQHSVIYGNKEFRLPDWEGAFQEEFPKLWGVPVWAVSMGPAQYCFNKRHPRKTQDTGGIYTHVLGIGGWGGALTKAALRVALAKVPRASHVWASPCWKMGVGKHGTTDTHDTAVGWSAAITMLK